MKKSSKIWKIEKYGHMFKSGYTFDIILKMPFIESCQLIYNTELDCLLDIVTEPENNGLKVYKHQTIEVEERDLESCIEFAYIKEKGDNWSFGGKSYSREEIEKMSISDYKYVSSWTDNPYYKSYTKTVYHWVEAFMQ